MLEYRLRRLPAAREIARRAGRAGARFPWESASTGFDVTPRSARDRAGRTVPVRTGLIEEHIVAQAAWAASFYTDWTGDEEFARGPGLELLVETARFWASRARMGGDGKAHIYGVIGPDEYHETVDDNAYTNVMARWNLRHAADAVDAATAPAGVGSDEVARWRHVADAMTDGFDPATGIYEQFAGFHHLEQLLIEEVSPRRPIAADLLLGADRVRAAQVLKQADVLMLHHQIPHEVAPGTLEPNLRFYEPRTAHGSSLSPAIHAALLARTGDHDRALDALRVAARMDLEDLTGTTSAGLHLATMGGLWQAFAFGFAGLRSVAGRLVVDPRHPPAWDELEMRVRHRGSRVTVRTGPSVLTIHAEPPAAVLVDGVAYTAGAGGLTFSQSHCGWQATEGR
jgi:trehalose/maltose hydrolase-like predicted phosphorylase